jgi:hypothetical protein
MASPAIASLMVVSRGLLLFVRDAMNSVSQKPIVLNLRSFLSAETGLVMSLAEMWRCDRVATSPRPSAHR